MSESNSEILSRLHATSGRLCMDSDLFFYQVFCIKMKLILGPAINFLRHRCREIHRLLKDTQILYDIYNIQLIPTQLVAWYLKNYSVTPMLPLKSFSEIKLCIAVYAHKSTFGRVCFEQKLYSALHMTAKCTGEGFTSASNNYNYQMSKTLKTTT